VGLDRFIDVGIRLPGDDPEEPVDDGGVPGQVARVTGL
jgi:4-hydroxy-tetrahydrodipicolinate reductase